MFVLSFAPSAPDMYRVATTLSSHLGMKMVVSHYTDFHFRLQQQSKHRLPYFILLM